MDVLLAVASKRDVRAYSGRARAARDRGRILDAGRLAGSARNRQPCRFVVAEGEARAAVAGAVYRAGNVLSAALVVASRSPRAADWWTSTPAASPRA